MISGNNTEGANTVTDAASHWQLPSPISSIAMADARLDVLSTLLRGAAIDGGAQSQRTLKAIAAHRAREPHHVLLHGWALLQRPERLGDDGALCFGLAYCCICTVARGAR